MAGLAVALKFGLVGQEVSTLELQLASKTREEAPVASTKRPEVLAVSLRQRAWAYVKRMVGRESFDVILEPRAVRTGFLFTLQNAELRLEEPF